jgi:hypothetical protein
MAVAEPDCNAIDDSWEEVGPLARHAVEAADPAARTRSRGMSQDEVGKRREPAQDEVGRTREPADVEAHHRREPVEAEPSKLREPAEDDPDVEAHVRSFGPPLIEDSSDPQRRH